MKLIHLSAKEFDRLAAETRLRSRKRAAARAVLVDGCSVEDTGESRQFVAQAVASIQSAFDKNLEPGAIVSTTMVGRAVTIRKLTDFAQVLEELSPDEVMTSKLSKPRRDSDS